MFNARHPNNTNAINAYNQLVARVQRLPFELQVRIFNQVLRNRRRRRARHRPIRNVNTGRIYRRGPFRATRPGGSRTG